MAAHATAPILEVQAPPAGGGYHISRLPPEMLELVLSNLVDEADINAAHNVCKLWLDMVDSLTGFPVRLSSCIWFERGGRKSLVRGLDIISWIGVNEIRIEEKHQALLPRPPYPSLKMPNMLKKLSIEFDIGREMFWMLTTPSTNLMMLKLSVALIRNLRWIDLVGLSCWRLRELILVGMGHNHPDDWAALPNLRMLLAGNNFPQLTLFAFKCLVDDSSRDVTSAVLVDFILRHTHLKRLIIHSRVYGDERIEEGQRNGLMNRIRGKRVWPSSVSLFIATDGSGNHKLSMWRELLRMMSGVKKLSVHLDSISLETLMRIISRNRATLKTLDVERTESRTNLHIFAPIRGLVKLAIYNAPEFHGAAHLPLSLKSLRLHGPILETDFRFVLFGLPALTHLRLHVEHAPLASGDMALYELNLETLKELILSPRRILKKVKLIGDQLRGWPTELFLWNDDPSAPPHPVFTNWPDIVSKLELVLTEDGFYVSRT